MVNLFQPFGLDLREHLNFLWGEITPRPPPPPRFCIFIQYSCSQYANSVHHPTCTIDWEIFVLNIVRATIFSYIFVVGAIHKNLSPGLFHRDEYGRALCLVASAFMVKSGRQLLEKYSCERSQPLRMVRAVAVW